MSYTEKKRSFVRRHSSRGKRSRQSPGHDSPRLDRHPSLRFSTTRLPSGRVVRPQPTVKACTLAVTKPPAVATAGETAVPSDDRKGSSGSNASSIGTCHDLRPSTSAYSMSRITPYLEGNRSSSSADTAAVTGVEGLKDDAVRRRLPDDDQGLLSNRAMDISHINLLRATPSEHELGSGRRRFEDGLDVQPSSTVDRLSPASCRRRPQTADTTPTDSSNHRRDVQADPRQADGVVPGAGDHTDLILIGVTILAVLLLTSPTMIVGLLVVMCTGRGGSQDRPVGVDIAFSLHVVAYAGALLRPVVYYTLSRTLRISMINLLRCRRSSNVQTRSALQA